MHFLQKIEIRYYKVKTFPELTWLRTTLTSSVKPVGNIMPPYLRWWMATKLRCRGPFHYCLIMTTPDGDFWNDIYLLHIHDETTNKTFHELDDLWAFLKGRIEVTRNSTGNNSVRCIEITPISVELRQYTRAVFTIKFKSYMTLDSHRFPINYEVSLYPGPVHITGRDMS